jgi:hypothetical protein
LAEVDISGIEEAKLKFKEKIIKNIKVKATVELSDSGLISVPKAYVIIEIQKENQGIIGGVMDFFSSSDKDKVLLLLSFNDRRKIVQKKSMIRKLRVNLKSQRRRMMLKRIPKSQS